MPTHALPLTRAHGPDTRSASAALPRRFSVPFPFPSANHLPPSFLRESQLRPLSVSAHDGLTFASSVSRYEVVTRTLAQRSGRLSRDNFEDTRRRRAKGKGAESCPSPDQVRRPLAARAPLQPISHLARLEQTQPRHRSLRPPRMPPPESGAAHPTHSPSALAASETAFPQRASSAGKSFGRRFLQAVE